VTVGTDAPVTGKTSLVARRLTQLVSTAGVGARIPSERDLAADWGVARMTVRNAIEILVRAGQLERRPGAGTYVVEPPYAKTLGLSSFTADMRNRGRVPSTIVLDFAEQPAGAEIALRLGVDEDEPMLRITRLRLADGQPIAVETNWIPIHLVPGLDAEAVTGSLFGVLGERYGITPGEATSMIDAVNPDRASAAALGISARAPCLRIRMEYVDQRLRPLMASTGLHVGSRYQLQITLNAGAFSPAATESATEAVGVPA
jgi:GntR family transcriptional regulator